MNVRGVREGRWTFTHRSVVGRAVIQFAALSLATLVVLGVCTALLSRHIARDEAVRDARFRGEGVADVAAQLVDSAVRAGDPDAMLALGTSMERHMRYASIRHILLWDAEGRILWAQDDRTVGLRYPLPEELDELLVAGGSMLEQPGHRTSHPGREAGEDDLLEVYVGTRDTNDVPFLFEAYIPAERIDEDYRALFRDLLPMTLGVLLLLQVATLPLAISLARRVDRVNSRRSLVLKSSLQSWHAERRHLAQDLHDGVVQDLSAIGYALPAVIDHLPDEASADAARATGRQMNSMLQRSLKALRSTVVDLSPDNFDTAGLAAALESLASRATDAGLTVSLHIEPGLDLGEAVSGLVYRVVREGLRNVDKHAEADAAVVEVRRVGDVVEVAVADDGRGVSATAAGQGHDGLRLLGRVAEDLGGTLQIGESQLGGAVLRVTIPVGQPGLEDQPT